LLKTVVCDLPFPPDQANLSQMMSNLLEYALKYTDGTAAARIEVAGEIVGGLSPEASAEPVPSPLDPHRLVEEVLDNWPKNSRLGRSGYEAGTKLLPHSTF